jgi:hypothetical protein
MQMSGLHDVLDYAVQATFHDIPNAILTRPFNPLVRNIFLSIFFYSGRNASLPEICFIYSVIFPAAPQEIVGDAGIEPGTAALQSGVILASCRLSHHIPNEPPNLH